MRSLGCCLHRCTCTSLEQKYNTPVQWAQNKIFVRPCCHPTQPQHVDCYAGGASCSTAASCTHACAFYPFSPSFPPLTRNICECSFSSCSFFYIIFIGTHKAKAARTSRGRGSTPSTQLWWRLAELQKDQPRGKR